MVKTNSWLLLCALTACAHVTGDERPALSVADAERAFAADAQVRTVNEAFLKAFAPDGIVFRPTPVNAQQAFTARPIPATLALRWTPTMAETAAAGDLGVTTGPSERGPRGQPVKGTGYFLSVWRAHGKHWQVVFDAGIDGPIPISVEQASSTLSRRTLQPSPSRSDDVTQMQNDLLHVERQLIEDYPTLIREHAASDVRVYRNGHAPTAHIGAAVGLVRAEGDVEWSPQVAFVSRSGDLGYVYGVARAGDDERGYVRIWRNQDGSWKVAYDLR
jgi:ketosteroid isomerase-like protein